MTRLARQIRQTERLVCLPVVIPPPVAQAFAELDSLDAMHPDARGTSYAGIRIAAARGNGAGAAQDGR
jgi:hypothetical protein